MDYLKKLLPLRQKLNLSQELMANEIGVSQQVYSLAENGKTKRVDPKIIEFITKNIGKDLQGNPVTPAESINESKISQQQESRSDSAHGDKSTVYILAESNRLLAESNRLLSQANLNLTIQVNSITEDSFLGIPSKMLPRFVSVLKLIAKAGAKGWKTEAVALADINNIFYADLGVMKEEGIGQH